MITKHSTNFLVLPAHCNYEPLIFGGFLMGEMDKCCAMLANRLLYTSDTAVDAVTVGVTDLSFPHGPVVKDIVFLEAEVVGIGIKSIKMKVFGWCEVFKENGKRIKTCEATFTFVSRDEDGNIVPHNLQDAHYKETSTADMPLKLGIPEGWTKTPEGYKDPTGFIWDGK